jgi:hypothetical protein
MPGLHYAKVAKISYLLDAGRCDGESIMLGVIALFHAADRPALLVLLCRARLDPEEQARLDPIAQRILAEPARFFAHELDAAGKARVPDLFAHLAQTFPWSIHVAPATYMPIPAAMVQDLLQALDLLDAASKRQEQARRGIIEVRPPDSAAAALARITDPEFPSGEMVALLPPAWMIGDTATRQAM